MVLLFTSVFSASANDVIEYTPIGEQSIIKGLIPKMCGLSSNNYNFTEWIGVSNMEKLTDGILSVNGVRDESVAGGCPMYSQNAAQYYYVYELDGYYDITSVAVWANLSRARLYIDYWEVYASETIADLLKDKSRTVGKESGSTEYDKQVATLYRKVKYIAFAFRHNNPGDEAIRVNEFEVFGHRSKDQSPPVLYRDIDLKKNGDITVTADIKWVFSNQENSEPDAIDIKKGDTLAFKQSLTVLDYYYTVYDVFDVSLTSNNSDIHNTDMDNNINVTISVPDILKSKENLMLAAIGENYGEIVCDSAINGIFSFTASNTERYAFVVPNYTENATLELDNNYCPKN